MSVGERFRAGLIGSHQVIRSSLANILAFTRQPGSADQTPAGMLVYQNALLHFIESHHKHEDEVFFPLFEGQLGAKWTAVAGRLSAEHVELHGKLDATRAKLVTLDPATVTWEQLRTVAGDFESLQTLLDPHLKAEEDIVTVEECERFDAAKVEETHQKMAAINKGDPNGYLTLPLMLWTLDDANYDLMVRPRMPKFVRAVLCNNVFYYKGASALVPFVPHYRGMWDI